MREKKKGEKRTEKKVIDKKKKIESWNNLFLREFGGIIVRERYVFWGMKHIHRYVFWEIKLWCVCVWARKMRDWLLRPMTTNLMKILFSHSHLRELFNIQLLISIRSEIWLVHFWRYEERDFSECGRLWGKFICPQ